ncbi:MAG TPA: VCBS repeat-containing protein [Desulfomonilaceae bacterium]|nr:VCBS repeat-containing protein [Desulfomonilaceae bacterium]
MRKVWPILVTGALLLGMLSVGSRFPAIAAQAQEGQEDESVGIRSSEFEKIQVTPGNVKRADRQYSQLGHSDVLVRGIVSAEARPDTTGPKTSGIERKTSEAGRVWQSEELHILGIGMGVGDVDGDGQNEIVVIDPGHVYLYRVTGDQLTQLAEYSAGTLELKAVDVAKTRKQGPCRIYVTAQNRSSIASFVLEYRNGSLVPVVTDFPYYLRVIDYPTRGPVLLGQQKGLRKVYDGPVYRLADKGNELEVQDRFGIPMKIPIFGFAIGDLEGKHQPLIAAYDKSDHLRVYTPDGKRLYLSRDYYGGSDVILRLAGPEQRARVEATFDNPDGWDEGYCRPRILALGLRGDSVQEILASVHSSTTLRMLSRSKMLDEGQVTALTWNGEALQEKWRSPKLSGMVIDFAVDTLPGIPGRRLIVLERKKTDWLAFLRSRTQIKAYDLESLNSGLMGARGGGSKD